MRIDSKKLPEVSPEKAHRQPCQTNPIRKGAPSAKTERKGHKVEREKTATLPLHPYRNPGVLCLRLSEPFPADPFHRRLKPLIPFPLLAHEIFFYHFPPKNRMSSPQAI
jgi:hypothetical protein